MKYKSILFLPGYLKAQYNPTRIQNVHLFWERILSPSGFAADSDVSEASGFGVTFSGFP